MTDSASARDAGDEVRYGSMTASSRSAPIASATRYATTAESIPPDSPTTSRSKPGLLELAADELGDDPAGDVGVDGELGRQLERRGSGASLGRGHAPRSRACGPRSPCVPKPIGSPGGSAAATSKPVSASSADGRVRGQPGALGDDPLQLAHVQLRALVAQQRQGDPLAPDVGGRDLDREQALVVERRREDGLAVRGDDLRPSPERDRLVDPDAVAEDDERRRQLGVGPHQRPPRGRRAESDLVGRREVAPRRRRDVDQDLGAVERQQLRHRQVPEVLADADPEPDPEPRRHRAQQVARREEPALVEQTVGRQEQLPVDVADLAVLEQGGRDEQPVVRRFLDERDDGRQPARRAPRGRPRRSSSSRIETSDARSWSW